jgi:hypothetical protein
MGRISKCLHHIPDLTGSFKMARRLFKAGGMHKIASSGPDQYSMSITIPPDEMGFMGRECPSEFCSPAYFKVKLGTGITGGQAAAYCPYCCHTQEPSGFSTREQIRYAKDVVLREAHKGVNNMIEDALGLGPSRKKKLGGGFLSIEMSYKPGSLPPLSRPLEEALRRDITCPHCGLEYAVFGLATWCSDCGADIFMVHVQTEYQVVEKMLGDIERRREELGARVAARDMENALEDTVSIFEAALRALTLRKLRENGHLEKDIELAMKKIGNGFQNIARAANLCNEILAVELARGMGREEIEGLKLIFEKRHPITHNLGIVDKKYLERVRTGELEGRDVPVISEEVLAAMHYSFRVLEDIHGQLFGEK